MQESKNLKQSNANQFMNRIKSDNLIQKNQAHVIQELHEKRVQSLKKELEYLKTTEWKYQPVNR